MPTISLNVNARIGGVDIAGTISRDAEGQIGQQVELAAAIAGTLSTRTSDTAGTLTLEGHAILEGETIDVYWAGGVAYGATAGVIAGDDVPFTGASGDALPAEDTAVNASPQIEINTDFDGDEVELLLAGATTRQHAEFIDDAVASIAGVELAAGEAWPHASNQGFTSPLAGNVVGAVRVSNGDSANAGTFTLGVLYDSV